MSVKEDTVSIHKSETSHRIQVLRGRTGNIVQVLSDRTAIFRDRLYGDITFTEDVLILWMKKEGSSFRSYFPVGKTVYFDIEVGVGHVNCISIWVSKKPKPDTAILLTDMEYRGKVIRMLPPFAFLVEVDSCKIPVLVFNVSFKRNHHAENLCSDQPVTPYVSMGDTVYVTVYRHPVKTIKRGKYLPTTEVEWSAKKAWREENNTSKPRTSSENPLCRVIKKQRDKKTCKTEKKIPIMKGKLSFVGSETAHLDGTDHSGTVIFHRDNAYLFGVPMKGLRLDQVFRTGEELNFQLSGDHANKASRVWFGSFDVVSQSFEERMSCILKYFKERGICVSDMTTIFQELGKQRPPDEERRDLEDQVEETIGFSAAEECNTLSTGSAVGRELNGSCENKTDDKQAYVCDTAEQMTLLSSTASSSTVVTGLIQNSSSITAAINESGSSAATKEHNTASQETSVILTAAEPTISNAIAAPEQGDCTSVALVTMKQNVFSVNEQTDLTIQTSSTADTHSENENHGSKASAGNFKDSAVKNNISSEIPEVTKIPLNTNCKVRTYFSKDNSSSTNEHMNQSNIATDEELNSTIACISEHADTSDWNTQGCGHMDLHKDDSRLFISDKETETLYSSNCDTDSESYMCIINKDVEHNLKASLMSVLKKQVGESASQILAPYAMGFVKKEIDCMMQELFIKALSYVLCDETEQKKLNSDLQCGAAARVMMTSMAQEWKEEMLLVTNKGKAVKKETEALLDRAQKARQLTPAVYCSNTASTQRNTRDQSSDVDYNEVTAEKSALVGIMKDCIQLQNISNCQMGGTPKSVSEQGSQTVSTGCILYLNVLSDL